MSQPIGGSKNSYFKKFHSTYSMWIKFQTYLGIQSIVLSNMHSILYTFQIFFDSHLIKSLLLKIAAQLSTPFTWWDLKNNLFNTIHRIQMPRKGKETMIKRRKDKRCIHHNQSEYFVSVRLLPILKCHFRYEIIWKNFYLFFTP